MGIDVLVSVAQKVNNAIHRINRYPLSHNGHSGGRVAELLY